jgi:hypothetical protein
MRIGLCVASWYCIYRHLSSVKWEIFVTNAQTVPGVEFGTGKNLSMNCGQRVPISCDSQDLTLQAVLLNGVATVR